jgi:hypothetical protein
MTDKERALLILVAKTLVTLIFWKNLSNNPAYDILYAVKNVEEEQKQ